MPSQKMQEYKYDFFTTIAPVGSEMYLKNTSTTHHNTAWRKQAHF